MATYTKKECEYCGVMFDPRGYSSHVWGCARRNKQVKLRDRKGTPTLVTTKEKVQYPKVTCEYCGKQFGPQGLTWHMKWCIKKTGGKKLAPQKVAIDTLLHPTENPLLFTYTSNMEEIYKILSDDAALCSAVCHLMAAKAGIEVAGHLRTAKFWIELKLKSLEG